MTTKKTTPDTGLRRYDNFYHPLTQFLSRGLSAIAFGDGGRGEGA